MAYVEAKFGLIIRDARPGDANSRSQNGPMDVDAVNSLSSGKGKNVIESTVVVSRVVLTFNATALDAKARAGNRLAKARATRRGGKTQGRRNSETFEQRQRLDNWLVRS